ncbi:helix-turn-helix domain-containing protein [Actinomadura citrea]|uniref:helix-turn-helix domain-containing protein n=1 Tax=Actinomadura citrea TaxID=46158 RepID=UPI003CE50A78
MIDIIYQDGRPRQLSDELDRLLTGAEIAALFRVNRRQPAEWVRQGRIKSVRTPGGHHRYRESAVRALLADEAEGVSA